MRYVLVQSPLMGPTTWSWAAAELTGAGHEVAVPDIRAEVMTGQPRSLIRAVVTAAGEEPAVLVGHSGAGFFLPLIVQHLEVAQLVFVDAGLPPAGGQATAGGEFLEQLRSLAVAGTLPAWSSWWGDDVMKMLVPDESRRTQIEAEMSEVPLAFFESPVDLPTGWSRTGGAFLLLSEAYRRDADRARSLGWPVIECVGGHLDVVNDPEAVAHAIVQLTS